MSELDDTTVILTPESQQPCEVLLVDDDELVRERMALLLQKAGYVVTLAGAEIVAERIRAALAAQPISTASGPIEATVSIGAAAIDATRTAGHLDHMELLRTADECLYRNKQAGRNRTTGIRLPR